jgi:hypothetical protein
MRTLTPKEVLAGTWVASGLALRGGGGEFVGSVLAAAFIAGGFVIGLGGLVGLVYKVVADANRQDS